MFRHSPCGEQRSDLSHSLISESTETLRALQIITALILSLNSLILKATSISTGCVNSHVNGSSSRVTKSPGIILKLCIDVNMFCCIILLLHHSVMRMSREWFVGNQHKHHPTNISSVLQVFSAPLHCFLVAAHWSTRVFDSTCYQQVWSWIFPRRLILYNLKPNALFLLMGSGNGLKRLLYNSLS